MGSKVEVVEFLDRLMPGMDAEVAKETMKFLKKQGLEFTMKTGVKSAKVENGKVTVTMESRDGGDPITKVYDKVLVSIGRRPFTAGLGLEVTRRKKETPFDIESAKLSQTVSL